MAEVATAVGGGAGLGDQPQLDRVIENFEGELRADYTPPHVKRHAHPKMHGCVLALLHIDPNVPPELRFGVFAARGETFKAWVRFSNALSLDHDMKYGNRGMAIKVLEVKGDRLLADQPPFSWEKGTQDFVLSTHSAFVLPNVTCYDYARASAALRRSLIELIKLLFEYRLWRGIVALVRGGIGAARNPLAIRYFSQTAYRLGPKIVKLDARPVITPMLARQLPKRFWFATKMLTVNVILNLSGLTWGKRLLVLLGFKGTRPAADDFCDQYIASRNLLRYALAGSLSAHAAQFEIGVQMQTNEQEMPSDNPTKVWSERRSGFQKVATLEIPKQVFWPAAGMPPLIDGATKRMVEVGENLSFNPWHGLPAHEPLGDINRARGKIYAAISEFRHGENHAERPDPLAEYDKLRDIVQCGRMEPLPPS
jgi:hypothetical protein